jgi:hypothetical protein
LIHNVAVDNNHFNARCQFERVTIQYDQVGIFAFFDAAEALSNAENLRGINSQTFQRELRAESVFCSDDG